MTSTEWWTELKSITLHVEGESPRLWPASASEEYQQARMELVRAEAELRDRIEAVAAQRRALPPGGELPDYTFVEGPDDLAADGPERPVTLSQLFAGHDSLCSTTSCCTPRTRGPARRARCSSTASTGWSGT